MVTNQTRNTVWISLFHIERLVRYYETLADRHSRKQAVLRIILLLAALSGIATFLDLLPPMLQVAMSAMLAACVAADYVLRYAEKAATLHAISRECSRLATDGKALWSDMEFIADEECRQRNTRLSQVLDEVTAWAGIVGVQEDAKLNVQCEATASQILEHEYGG